MKIIYCFSILFIATLLFTCSNENGGGLFSSSKLPEKPEKINIEWHDDGGMLPESETIYLSEDSSYWAFWRYDYEQKIYFDVTKDELTNLYAVFVENEFDQIRLIEEQEVYDRGGTTIRLTCDGNYFDKNNSGMTFIHESDVKNYVAVENAIYDFAKTKIEPAKTPFTITFSDELLNSGEVLSFNMNGRFLISNEEHQFPRRIDTTLYSTYNDFELMVYDGDSLNSYGTNQFLYSVRCVKAVSDTSNLIEFVWEKDSAALKD